MTTDTMENTSAEFVGRGVDEYTQDVFTRGIHSAAPYVIQNSSSIAAKVSAVKWSGGAFASFAGAVKQAVSLDSILTNPYIEKAVKRLSSFADYDEDWNGEGAAAPVGESLAAAASFLAKLEPWHPRPIATLSSEGNCVIEFYDDQNSDFWGSITFTSATDVEIYVSSKILNAGNFYEGPLGSPKSLRLLSNGLQITLKP